MLLNPPMMNLTGSSTITSDVNYHALTMTSRLSGSGNITWSSITNPSRVTAVVAGTYQISGTLIWPGTLGSADGRAEIHINGSTITNTRFNTIRGSAGNSASVCSGLEVLNAGDYVEIYANQQSGVSVTLTANRFCVSLVSLATA